MRDMLDREEASSYPITATTPVELQSIATECGTHRHGPISGSHARCAGGTTV